MARIKDNGRRIELVSMDTRFEDISIGLYQQQAGDGVRFLVHTYSGLEGAQARIEFVAAAMKTLGGMESGGDDARLLRFPCGAAHAFACRRIFLEACKLATGSPLEAKPLTIFDKKSGRTISVAGGGDGTYRLSADGEQSDGARRVTAVARGLVKLAEMELDADDRVRFACGRPHDALIGLLLGRALNVRMVMRELEDQASRGVLAAPSAQSQ